MAKPEKSEKYAYLDQLSTECLQELLRADLNSDSTQGNSEVIFYILEVMEQRERENPTGQLVNVKCALEEFQTYYNIPEGEGSSLYPGCAETNTTLQQASAEQLTPCVRPRRLQRVFRACITVAAIVALLFTILVGVQASGFDIAGAFARWTESAFSFGLIQSERAVEAESTTGQGMNISSDPVELPSEYQEVWNELKAHGISSLMFPTDLPEGFQIEESSLYVQPEFDSLNFSMWYTIGNNDIIFSLLHNERTYVVYEKDEQEVEMYAPKNVNYYIFSNNGRNIAAWYTDGLEYSMSTELSVPELKSILDSMYHLCGG